MTKPTNTTSRLALTRLASLSRKDLAALTADMLRRWGSKAHKAGNSKTSLLKQARSATAALVLELAARGQKKRVLHVEAMGRACCTLDDAEPTLAELLATPMTTENVRPTCRACIEELGLEDADTLAEEAAAKAQAATPKKARKAAKGTSRARAKRAPIVLLITEATPIFGSHGDQHFAGNIAPNCEVTINGDIYASPSKALAALAPARKARCGWRFFRVVDAAGTTRTLGSLREDQKYAKAFKN